MNKVRLEKVALNAVRSPRRIMYAYTGVPVRAPRGGIVIQGFPYQAGELIPALAIQTAETVERDALFALLAKEKLARRDRLPGPGQQSFSGMEAPTEDQLYEDRLRNARWFSPRDKIPQFEVDRDIYTAMYEWMMDHYKPWYKNLTSDQERQAVWDRDVKITEMNYYLNGNRNADYDHDADSIDEGIRVFDSLVDDAPPLDRDTVLYRGLRNAPPEEYGNLKKGNVFANPRFMSMSIDPHVSAEAFMSSSSYASPGQLLLRVLAPRGTRAAGVTAQQIYKHQRKLQDFLSYSSYEQELTLPRDSQFRIRSDPHLETFKIGSRERIIRVMDLELLPQPTPEEAPQLPHEEIPSFPTGAHGSYGSDDDDDDDYDHDPDPWEDHDPDDIKNEKISELETLIEGYEENPAHDAEALQELRDLKDELEEFDHTDYGDPYDFDYALGKIINKAEKIIDEAPDHTEELWDQFQAPRGQEPSQKDGIIRDYLQDIDRVIQEFGDVYPGSAEPLVTDILSQLNGIRGQIEGSARLDLAEHYDNPDEFISELSAKIVRAQDLADTGHALYAEQAAGKPPLFAGADLEPNQLKSWMVEKKRFDGYVAKTQLFDSPLADRLQAFWDKLTHELPSGYETDKLITKIMAKASRIADGEFPDEAIYGTAALNDLENDVNRKVMVHNAVQANVKHAKESGVFQDKGVTDDYLAKYSKKLHDFNKYLSTYRKQQVAAGHEISPEAGRAQGLWDLAVRELSPDYSTAYHFDNLVNFAAWLKNGAVANYHAPKLDHVAAGIQVKIIADQNASPAAKLLAKQEKFNSEYFKALKGYQNSYYHDPAASASFAQKFHDYLKTKGIEHVFEMAQLPPEVQDQVFAQADQLVKNIGKASSGYIPSQNIWPTPTEEIPPPPTTAVQRAVALLEAKKTKNNLLKQFADTMYSFGGTPGYNTETHKKLNDLMAHAMKGNTETPTKLKGIQHVVDLAQGVFEGNKKAKDDLGIFWSVLTPKKKDIPTAQENLPSAEKSFEQNYSKAGSISGRLHKYEDMPYHDQEALGSLGEKYNKLREEWNHEPKGRVNDVYYQSQLNQLENDVEDTIATHSKKLWNVSYHSNDIQRKLQNKDSVAELEKEFPTQTNQFHLDMANYISSEHYDHEHRKRLIGDYQSIAEEHTHDHDWHQAENDLVSLLGRTRDAVTRRGEYPHQKFYSGPDSVSPAEPSPSSISKEKVAAWIARKRPINTEGWDAGITTPKPEIHGPPGDVHDPDKPSHLNYESLTRRIVYARNKLPLIPPVHAAPTGPEDPTPTRETWNHAVVLSDPGDILGPGRDIAALKKINDWQLDHYQNWSKGLEPEEKRMASWDRPVRISHMNSHLAGKGIGLMDQWPSGWTTRHGMEVLDHIIRKAPPLPRDMIVYRGITSNHPLFEGMEPGHVYTHKPYMSSTPDLETARFFATDEKPHNMIMRILLRRGDRAAGVTAHQVLANHIPLDYIQAHPRTFENELTLPRGSQYRVLSHPYVKHLRVRRGNGEVLVRPHRFIDLEHVPEPEFDFMAGWSRRTYARGSVTTDPVRFADHMDRWFSDRSHRRVAR